MNLNFPRVGTGLVVTILLCKGVKGQYAILTYPMFKFRGLIPF